MSRLIKIILLLVMPALVLLIASCTSNSNEKKVGIVVPLENKSLDEIVEGFKTTLATNLKVPYSIKVANAQGDLNLERAIIAQMKSEHYDVIAPIGTAATQMSLAMTKQPVVGIAANYDDNQRAQLKHCNLAVVSDEISPLQIVEFIHQVYPNIHEVTLIHSGTEKIYADVQTAILAGKKYDIKIIPMMAPTLNDLYSVANSLPQTTQAILILKDILIASGTPTLAHVAANRHIPFIAADQGSVQDGAAFAVAVHEKNIGVQGALLTQQILDGKKACELPIVTMKKLTVFVNPQSLKNENLSMIPLEQAAKQKNYNIQIVSKGS